MIISNLSYLETVSNSDIVGGTKKGHKPPKPTPKKPSYTRKSVAVAVNVNVTKQTAVAISKYGDAYAINSNSTTQYASASAK